MRRQARQPPALRIVSGKGPTVAEQDWNHYPFADESKRCRQESGMNGTEPMLREGRELLGFTDGDRLELLDAADEFVAHTLRMSTINREEAA